MRTMLVIWVVGALTAQTVSGQATQPAGEREAATQPSAAEAGQPGEAVIDEVKGTVRYAVTRPDGTLGDWTVANVGDRLPPGTRIQTLFDSHVLLVFTDETQIMIESLTMASIDDFRRSADTKTVKLGIAHGAIRGASTETTLRSDLTIESPTATLSKRGTIGFRIKYEPVTGDFVISLKTEGLVEALNKITGETRLIRPGQYMTEAMRRWIVTAIFNDYVPVIDIHGMTDADHHFGAFHASGISKVEPSAGWNVRSQIGIDPTPLYIEQQRFRRTGRLLPIFLFRDGGRPSGSTPEGNFGTGPGS